MTDTPTIPCELTHAGKAVFNCPWCGGRHYHGCDPALVEGCKSYRVSHCDHADAPGGYYLRLGK